MRLSTRSCRGHAASIWTTYFVLSELQGSKYSWCVVNNYLTFDAYKFRSCLLWIERTRTVQWLLCSHWRHPTLSCIGASVSKLASAYEEMLRQSLLCGTMYTCGTYLCVIVTSSWSWLHRTVSEDRVLLVRAGKWRQQEQVYTEHPRVPNWCLSILGTWNETQTP